MRKIAQIILLMSASAVAWSCENNEVPSFLRAASASQIVVIGKIVSIDVELNEGKVFKKYPVVEVEEVIKGNLEHKTIALEGDVHSCFAAPELNLTISNRYVIPVVSSKRSNGKLHNVYGATDNNFKLITNETVCCIKGGQEVYALSQLKKAVKEDLGYVPSSEQTNSSGKESHDKK